MGANTVAGPRIKFSAGAAVGKLKSEPGSDGTAVQVEAAPGL